MILNEIGIKTDKTFDAVIRYNDDLERQPTLIHFIDIISTSWDHAFVTYEECNDMFSGETNYGFITHPIKSHFKTVQYKDNVYDVKSKSGRDALMNHFMNDTVDMHIIHGENSYTYIDHGELKTINALPVHIKYPGCDNYSTYNIVTGRPGGRNSLVFNCNATSDFTLMYTYNNKLYPFCFCFEDIDSREYMFKIGNSDEEYVMDTKADIDIFVNNIKTELQLIKL